MFRQVKLFFRHNQQDGQKIFLCEFKGEKNKGVIDDFVNF